MDVVIDMLLSPEPLSQKQKHFAVIVSLLGGPQTMVNIGPDACHVPFGRPTKDSLLLEEEIRSPLICFPLHCIRCARFCFRSILFT